MLSKDTFELSHFFKKRNEDANIDDIFYESFFRDHYLSLLDVADSVYLTSKFSFCDKWSNILSTKHQKQVQCISIGIEQDVYYKKYSNIIRMGIENARLSLKERLLIEQGYNKQNALRYLQEILGLNKLPSHIEAYDISNLQGHFAVGSGVTLKNGTVCKSLYRKYRIRGDYGIDDPRMLYEVLSRRFVKIDTLTLPDLILVDGGPIQLQFAHDARKYAQLEIPIISLAKKEEKNLSF